jgi:hypothetical protein
MVKNKKEQSVSMFNSVQLNLVTFVDVDKAATTKSLDGAVFMIDNSPMSTGQGTPHLQTTCKQGQVLNWIIYAMDADRRPDGTWPPSVRINNIVFLDEVGKDVTMTPICHDMKVFGGPDKIRSAYTPVYYYWAGTVPVDLAAGIYKYRLILDLETGTENKSMYLNLDTPSLKVVEVN